MILPKNKMQKNQLMILLQSHTRAIARQAVFCNGNNDSHADFLAIIISVIFLNEGIIFNHISLFFLKVNGIAVEKLTSREVVGLLRSSPNEILLLIKREMSLDKQMYQQSAPYVGL